MNFSTWASTGVLQIAFCIVLATGLVYGQSTPEMPDREHLLLSETYRLAEQVRDSVWAGWSTAPFPILLVTPSREYLVRHPSPSSEFASLGYDAALGDTVYARPAQFSPNLRATFPAVGGVPTIVIGPPDSTESLTQWVLTAMHEHFHQWQMSRPGYYDAVDALGLADGDDSGQWMLNYPFPYDSTAVHDRFRELRRDLRTALASADKDGFDEHLERYLRSRREFRRTLSDDDYSYFSFQLWQEGVARYVEYKVAKYAAEHYEPSGAFRAIERTGSFVEAAASLRRQVQDRLSSGSLATDGRVAFYPVGAAEALLLDHVSPDWRQHYWAKKFDLERHYDVSMTSHD